MTDSGDLPEDASLSLREMLERGVLQPELRHIANSIFEHADFTLVVLQSHLLIEKGLNTRLTEKGIPAILLGPTGLQFHQKYKALKELRGDDPNGATMFEVLNTLRNNVAHDFWDEQECVRTAFRRVFPKKSQYKVVEDAVRMGIDAVKLLFLMLALDLGIVVPDDSLRQHLIDSATSIDILRNGQEKI